MGPSQLVSATEKLSGSLKTRDHWSESKKCEVAEVFKLICQLPRHAAKGADNLPEKADQRRKFVESSTICSTCLCATLEILMWDKNDKENPKSLRGIKSISSIW